MGKHLGRRHIDDFAFEPQLISRSFAQASMHSRRTASHPKSAVVSRETPQRWIADTSQASKVSYVDWETGVSGRELAIDP